MGLLDPEVDALNVTQEIDAWGPPGLGPRTAHSPALGIRTQSVRPQNCALNLHHHVSWRKVGAQYTLDG